MSAALESRLGRRRARLLARSFAYRQRHHAHGVWFRLRRALTAASAAFVIPPEEARTLMAEGHRAAPVGEELEPPKLIVFVPVDRIARIAAAQPVAVRLSADVLAAEGLALVPFDPDA